MSHLSTTLMVDASAEVVYDLLADPARAPEWRSLPEPSWDRSPAGPVGSARASWAITASPAGSCPPSSSSLAAERPSLPPGQRDDDRRLEPLDPRDRA